MWRPPRVFLKLYMGTGLDFIWPNYTGVVFRFRELYISFTGFLSVK